MELRPFCITKNQNGSLKSVHKGNLLLIISLFYRRFRELETSKKCAIMGERNTLSAIKVLKYNALATLLFFFSVFFGLGQSSPNPINGTGPYTNMLNCTGTPTYSVNLTGSPAGTWQSNPQVRAGSCCVPPDNNCVQFIVTLDPDAEGIIFNVPDGCGAAPSGSLFYQVDCGPLTSVGSPLCLNGTGPFIITFCKPGNNANCYAITSIPAPASGGDVVTADGCQDTLTVTGVTQASTTWTSISPGTTGQYNNYLNNLAGSQPGVSGTTYTGQTTVVVTPQPGFPPVIQYRVCGNVVGGCSSATFCDTVSVSIFPNLFAQINPANPSICFGSAGTTLTAVPIGGTAPYTYLWNGPSANGATTSSIFATVPGVYTLSISDATGCPAATTTVTVTQYTNTITANAGPDVTRCRTPIPTITLNGSVTGVTTGIWSGGAGTYSPSNTSLTLNYTPTAAELASGSVTLTLTTTNNGSCPGSSDQVVITLPQFSSTLNTIPTNVLCNGQSNGAINLSVVGGASPGTYSWSNGATTEDINALAAGTYTVSVTDVNGCVGTTSQAITQPAILTSSIASQTNVSCFGGSNASVTISGAGGTTPYQFSINGGPQQASGTFSGLAAGSYTVTITDANGCTVNQSVTVTQPAAAVSVTFTQSNVLCFGGANGSIDITPAGGTSPYTYSWSNGATTQDVTGLSAGTYSVIINDANGSTGGCTTTTSVTIAQPTAPVTVSTTQQNVLCNGGSSGSIDLSVSGGTAPYTYLWSNGATTQDISGLPAGTYSVIVNDANGSTGGCTATTSVTITQPAPLTQSTSAFTYPSGSNISCFGLSNGSIDLTIGGGTPGYTYTWSNGATTQDISGLPVGTYSVTATDANGCIITTALTLIQPPALNSTVTPAVYAGGFNVSGCVNDGSIDLGVTGGSPGFTYLWSNGAVTQDISSLGAGTYSVTITDLNGCQTTNSVTLTAPNPVAASVTPFVYPSGTNISCFGASDGSVDLGITGGTPIYTYLWSNGATTQDLTNVPAGTYSVTITDALGCQTTASVTLTQPTALTSGVVPSVYAGGFNVSGCVPDGEIDLSVSGGNPGYTYLWSNGSTTQDVINLVGGSYTVTVTDLNGCQTISTITLTQPSDLAQTISAFTYPSGTNISCFGLSDGSINLNITGGTPGYSYVWSNGATTEDLNNVPAGTYGVLVTDANGCQVSSSITLVQPPALTQSITAAVYQSGTNISCFGLSNGSIDLTVSGGNPGYSYTWSNGGTTQDISGLPAGTYNVTVTDVNGCTIPSTITLTQPVQLTSSVSPSIVAGGFNLSGCVPDGTADLTVNGGNPGYTYSWSNGSVTQDITNLAAGTYNVTITDVNGCQTTSSVTLIAPPILTQSVSAFVYPSGTNVSCVGQSDGSVDLVIGGGVAPYTYLWNNGAITQDLSNIPAGTYSVIVTDANGCQITSSITLTQPAPLAQTISAFVYPGGTNISCLGASDGSIDFNILGGNSGYSFLWNTGATTEDLSGVPAGTYSVVATDLNGCTISSSIILTQPTALTTNISAFTYIGGSNVSCAGASDGSIDLSVNGGSPGYTYTWNTGATSQDISGLPIGTYTVTATDINGCQVNTSITLIEPTPLSYSQTLSVVNGGFNTSGCFNDGSINLTVSGSTPGYTYLWNTGELTQDVSGLDAGTFSVTITDANGCTLFVDTTLNEAPPVTATAQVVSDYNGQDVSCFGASDGSVSVTPGGGVAPYNFQWVDAFNNPVSTNQTPTGLLAGTYTVTVTDANGCTNFTSVTIVNPPAISSLAVVSTDYNGQDISCFGASDGGIDLTVNGGTPGYSYAWTNDLGTYGSIVEDPSSLIAGTYNVVVTDANGCQSNSSVTLTEPPLLAGVADVITDYNGEDISCYGAADAGISVTSSGGTPTYTYVWTNSSGGLVGTAQTMNDIDEGIYQVQIIDVNGCIASAPVVVTQPEELFTAPIVISNYFGLAVSCVGATDGIVEAYVDGGTPSYNFSWGTTPDITVQTPNNLGEGTYVITVTDANGCVATASVTLEANPLPQYTLPPPIFGCIGGELFVTSNAQPGTNCQWTFSNGMVFNDCELNLMFETATCVDAQLVVSTTLGCADTVMVPEFICVEPNPVATFTIEDYDLTSTNFDTYFYNLSTNATSYIWDFGDGSAVSNEENPYHQFPQTWPYEFFSVWLYAISDLGCIDSTVRYINYQEDMLIYVPNTFTPDQDEFNNDFFPVLTSGFNPNNYTMYIFNRWGELIFESRDVNVGWDGTYNGGLCQDGTYVWKIIVMDKVTDAKKEFIGHVNLIR
jgi:gliding motility-associated-like protein